MRRVRLWLKKDGRKDAPEYFIKDFVDLDDRYQKGRFDNRTFSDDDKFEEGKFYSDTELQELIESALVKERAKFHKNAIGDAKIIETQEQRIKDLEAEREEIFAVGVNLGVSYMEALNDGIDAKYPDSKDHRSLWEAVGPEERESRNKTIKRLGEKFKDSLEYLKKSGD